MATIGSRTVPILLQHIKKHCFQDCFASLRDLPSIVMRSSASQALHRRAAHHLPAALGTIAVVLRSTTKASELVQF